MSPSCYLVRTRLRSVPRRLVAEVPQHNLDNPGTSGTEVRLKKSTREGALDKCGGIPSIRHRLI